MPPNSLRPATLHPETPSPVAFQRQRGHARQISQPDSVVSSVFPSQTAYERPREVPSYDGSNNSGNTNNSKLVSSLKGRLRLITSKKSLVGMLNSLETTIDEHRQRERAPSAPSLRKKRWTRALSWSRSRTFGPGDGITTDSAATATPIPPVPPLPVPQIPSTPRNHRDLHSVADYLRDTPPCIVPLHPRPPLYVSAHQQAATARMRRPTYPTDLPLNHVSLFANFSDNEDDGSDDDGNEADLERDQEPDLCHSPSVDDDEDVDACMGMDEDEKRGVLPLPLPSPISGLSTPSPMSPLSSSPGRFGFGPVSPCAVANASIAAENQQPRFYNFDELQRQKELGGAAGAEGAGRKVDLRCLKDEVGREVAWRDGLVRDLGYLGGLVG